MIDGEEQRQGTGGLQKRKAVVIVPGHREIFGLAGVQIGDHRLDLAGIGGEGVVVEGDQLIGNDVVGEVQPPVAAVFGVEQVAQTHVTLVIGVADQNLQIAAGLLGDVADAIGDARRHADDVIEHNVVLQEGVPYARGEDRAEGAAFQHKTGFHRNRLLSQKRRAWPAPCANCAAMPRE